VRGNAAYGRARPTLPADRFDLEAGSVGRPESQSPEGVTPVSKEDIEKFRADVENDPALLSELQGHQDQAAFVSKATSLARSRGYDISEDEIHSYLASNQQGELSDEALRSVAGGTQGNLGKYTYSRPGCN
jgi:predicted ribosomally synthesized peptide with nif11-like leader